MLIYSVQAEMKKTEMVSSAFDVDKALLQHPYWILTCHNDGVPEYCDVGGDVRVVQSILQRFHNFVGRRDFTG